MRLRSDGPDVGMHAEELKQCARPSLLHADDNGLRQLLGPLAQRTELTWAARSHVHIPRQNIQVRDGPRKRQLNPERAVVSSVLLAETLAACEHRASVPSGLPVRLAVDRAGLAYPFLKQSFPSHRPQVVQIRSEEPGDLVRSPNRRGHGAAAVGKAVQKVQGGEERAQHDREFLKDAPGQGVRKDRTKRHSGPRVAGAGATAMLDSHTRVMPSRNRRQHSARAHPPWIRLRTRMSQK